MLLLFSAFTSNAHISTHSPRQYVRVLYPSLNTTPPVSLLTDMGPKPGAPWPPRMQVGTHFLVQFVTKRWFFSLPAPDIKLPILGVLSLESPESNAWGTVSKYSSAGFTVLTESVKLLVSAEAGRVVGVVKRRMATSAAFGANWAMMSL